MTFESVCVASYGRVNGCLWIFVWSGVPRMCGVATARLLLEMTPPRSVIRQVQGAPHRVARLDLVRIILRLSGRGDQIMSASGSVVSSELSSAGGVAFRFTFVVGCRIIVVSTSDWSTRSKSFRRLLSAKRAVRRRSWLTSPCLPPKNQASVPHL